jgi:N-acetylneuraminate synthase
MGAYPEITIAGRKIGREHPPFIVAEMSANHRGDLDVALALIDAAAEAGADAVKLQTYTADTITIDAERPEFKITEGLWRGYTLHRLYDEAHMPWDWHEALFARGRKRGVIVFSTPFDATAVSLLEQLGAPAYKVASFELIDLPLIETMARCGKPMIMATGNASLAEIGEAVAAARKGGAREIALLHAVSGYPTPIEQANVRTIPHLAEAFGVTTGLSDHTLGVAAAIAAVAQGASIIEKHVTLSRADGGHDSSFSLEPHELKRLVEDCRGAWQALGRVTYERQESEQKTAAHRRSLYVVRPVAKGELLTSAHVRSIRPGNGLAPKFLPEVLGRTAARDLAFGEPLGWEMLA